MASSPYSRIGRPRHPDVLTPAEWEVLAGVREGRTNREIAQSRGCDLETVRFHLRNVRRKLAVQSREELIAFPGRPTEVIQRAASAAPAHRVREQIPLVHTRDMLRALDFYVGALGFEVVSRWPDDAAPPRWAALAAGGARLMLRCGHPRREIRHGGRPGVVTMNFYVEGIEAFHRELIASGYECDAIETLFYGAREFYVLDPDSNEVSIVEFAASDPGYMASPKGRTPKREPSAQKAGGRRETRAKRRTR